jgi:hypothetical protein
VRKETYEAWSRAVSLSLKITGVAGIIFVIIFWAVTDRVVLAFLPFCGTLAGVGQGLDVLREISQSRGGERAENAT